jgi:hypothetical protein
VVEAEPPGDARTVWEAMANRTGPRALSPLGALRLACATARVLAVRGKLRDARTVFNDAHRRLLAISNHIQSDETRERFLERAAGPLREALRHAQEGVPLFIPEKAEEIANRVRYCVDSLACAGLAVLAIYVGIEARATHQWGQSWGTVPLVAGALLAAAGLVDAVSALRRTGASKPIASLSALLNLVLLAFGILVLRTMH